MSLGVNEWKRRGRKAKRNDIDVTCFYKTKKNHETKLILSL